MKIIARRNAQVRALQTAAKNFDQGQEDFSAVVHGVRFDYSGDWGGRRVNFGKLDCAIL